MDISKNIVRSRWQNQKNSPIFLSTIYTDFRPVGITHFQLQNGIMLLGIRGRNLQSIRLQSGKQISLSLPIDEVDKIEFVHLDHSGSHAIISTAKGDNFYLCMKSPTTLRPLKKKISGLVICSVGWNQEHSQNDTGFIVVGTREGSLIEMSVSSQGQMNYSKILTNSFGENGTQPIQNLSLHQFSDSDEEIKRYVLFVCVPGRLYALAGVANLEAAEQSGLGPQVGIGWSTSLLDSQTAVLQGFFELKTRLKCLKGGNEFPGCSSFVVHPIIVGEPPQKFAWINSDGLTIGAVDVAFLRDQTEKAFDASDAFKITHFIKHNLTEGCVERPMAIALTEYHAVQLFDNRLVAVSSLDKSVAFEEQFPSSTRKLLGLCNETSTCNLWVFFDSQIVTFRPTEEGRNAWRFYMNQRDFLNARKIAGSLSDPMAKKTVIRKEAEKFIAENNFVAAAELLSTSGEQFEASVLKFLRSGRVSRNGLKRFLELKLSQFGGSSNSEDKIRRDLLVLWLLEIQLGELAELRRGVTSESPATTAASSSTSSENRLKSGGAVGSSSQLFDELRGSDIKKVRDELYCYLNRGPVLECVGENRRAVFNMCSSHLDFETELHLAQRLKDYEHVVRILILQQKFLAALDVLTEHCPSELLCKYAPELLTVVPIELVAALIKQQRELKAVRLLPTFSKCFDIQHKPSPKMLAAVFCYFDQVTLSSAATSVASSYVLNFIVHLYATFKPNSLKDCLKKLVHNHKNASKRKANGLPFNVGQALRICSEKGLTECSVFLHTFEGRYEEAVRLALNLDDINMAKQCALELNKRYRRIEEAFQHNFFGATTFEEDDAATQVAAEGKKFSEADHLNPFAEDVEEERTLNDDDFFDVNEDLCDEEEKERMLEMRKRVWLEIAKRQIAGVQSDDDIAAGLALLSESDGVLGIQDILEFFPDFTTISHFKQPLCTALHDHAQDIQDTQRKIAEVSQMNAELRADLERAKSNYIVVKTSDRCARCREPMLTRAFLAFSCRHFFHRDCLEAYMLGSEFSHEEKAAYEKAAKQEELLARRRAEAIASSKITPKEDAELLARVTALRKQIKNLLADDCPLCGYRAINAVGRPFFTDVEYQRQQELWSFR